MARCPLATWKPVTAHGGPMTNAPLGVVIHVTEGTGDPYNEFANPANGVSSHFGIGNGRNNDYFPDGELEQYVDTGTDSWAQVAGNDTYLSVETEGEPTFGLSDAQIETFAQLIAWMHTEHGIPLVITDTPGQPGFITHGDGGQAWGGHLDCPGTLRKAQRQAILDRAAQVLNPQPQEEFDMQLSVHDPRTGGVWLTDADGELYAEFGAPMIPDGGLNSHPQWNAGETESGGKLVCVGIDFWNSGTNDGIVYICKAADGAKNPDGSPYFYYRIRRTGTPD